MNDQVMSILAATLEIGLLLGLFFSCMAWPATRRRFLVVLGAITPLAIAYASTAAQYLLLQHDEAKFGFFAMWEMSFLPHLACVVLGLLLAQLSVPKNHVARFAMGMVAPGLVGALIAGGM